MTAYQPILQGGPIETGLRRIIQPQGPQHTKILQNLAPSPRSPIRLRRLHDEPHNRHIPRHPNEKHRVPTQHLRSVLTIHNTQNANIKNRSIKEIIRAGGLNPEETFTKQAMSTPHRTIASPEELENKQIKILCNALETEVEKELRPTE